MRKILRVILLLTPLIIVGLALYEKDQWHPPIDPNTPQLTHMGAILDNTEIYKAPMTLIINGVVYNKSISGDFIFLGSTGYFQVNSTEIDVSGVEPGMVVYLRGTSYYHDSGKLYFLAEDIEIHVTYSLYLSIPGAVLILVILFVGFKFILKDFSFSRKTQEESTNA